jgi:hypothetical protein
MLSDHFMKKGVSSEIYAVRWILTLFATDLQLELVFSIFDFYLFERNSIIIKAILVILKVFEKDLLKKDEDEILTLL